MFIIIIIIICVCESELASMHLACKHGVESS